MLSTELVYATHKYTWSKKKLKLTRLPTYNRGAYGIIYAWLFSILHTYFNFH